MVDNRQYQIQSEHTSGSTAKHYHGVSISTLNEWAKNNIPTSAVLTSIQVYYKGKTSLGDTKLYVGFSNSSSDEPSQKLISTEVSTSAGDGWYGNIPSYSSTYPFNINTSYSTLSVYMNSGIIYKKFTCYDFRVIYNFEMPTHTVTLVAGTGGTVSGGGTVEHGKTTTITATPNTGYRFVKWTCNNGSTYTNNPLTIAVGSNLTFTAEFERIEYEVIVECQESVSGKKCTVTGGGKYYYGDTITLTASSIPNHRVDFWAYKTQYLSDYWSMGAGGLNSVSIALTEENFTGFYADTTPTIQFKCYLEHTGFTVKANVSPNSSAGSVNHGFFYPDYDWYTDHGVIPVDGFIVSWDERDVIGIKAIANEGYRFVKWNDGNTDRIRKVEITADITYTAIFEIDINVTYDSIFNFKKWAATNLDNWTLMKITGVADTGFTGKALAEDAYTLESRPLISVEAGKNYTLEADVATNVGFQLFAFSCDETGRWDDDANNIHFVVNDNFLRFTARRNYLSIRCDIDGTGNVATFSNFRIYPSEYPYMSNSVPATERVDRNAWSMPTPTREDYDFIGWNTKSDGTGVTYTSDSAFPTSDLVLYSQWRRKPVTATFKNYDGTVLQSVSVAYGKKPAYTGSEPTKSSTAEYDYIFSGWSPSLDAITSDTTYIAQFIERKRKYTLTVVSDTGGYASGGGQYEYGSTATLTATADDGYEFVKWSDGNTSPTITFEVTERVTYTAYFRVNRVLGDLSRAKKLMLDFDEVKALLANHTIIHEKD